MIEWTPERTELIRSILASMPQKDSIEMQLESAVDEIERLKAVEYAARNMIAVFNGDGGHLQEEIGFDKSCGAAVDKFHNFRQEIERLQKLVARLDSHIDNCELNILLIGEFVAPVDINGYERRLAAEVPGGRRPKI